MSDMKGNFWFFLSLAIVTAFSSGCALASGSLLICFCFAAGSISWALQTWLAVRDMQDFRCVNDKAVVEVSPLGPLPTNPLLQDPPIPKRT